MKDTHSSQSGELGGLSPRAGQGRSPRGLSPWPVHGRLLPASSHGRPLCVAASSSLLLIRTPVRLDEGHPSDLTLPSSPLYRPLSKCSPVLRSWGSGPPQANWEDTVTHNKGLAEQVSSVPQKGVRGSPGMTGPPRLQNSTATHESVLFSAGIKQLSSGCPV